MWGDLLSSVRRWEIFCVKVGNCWIKRVKGGDNLAQCYHSNPSNAPLLGGCSSTLFLTSLGIWELGTRRKTFTAPYPSIDMAEKDDVMTEKQYADLGRAVVSAIRKNAVEAMKVQAGWKALMKETSIEPT